MKMLCKFETVQAPIRLTSSIKNKSFSLVQIFIPSFNDDHYLEFLKLCQDHSAVGVVWVVRLSYNQSYLYPSRLCGAVLLRKP